MRKGSSTVVAVVGRVPEALLDLVGRAPNVAALKAEGEGFEEAANALARAEGVAAPYVVTVDPFAEVAEHWTAIWTPGSGDHSFETVAGRLATEWRAGRFQLPDYYIVAAGDELHEADWHLGFLKSQRPARVVLVPLVEPEGELALRVLSAIEGLPQGPWWPGVDRLMDAARDYFPGTITPETRNTAEVFRAP
jgi:hypothetical protein